jgi:hypothetical protein
MHNKETTCVPPSDPASAPRAASGPGAEGVKSADISPLDVLWPVLLHGVLLVALVAFARLVVPRFASTFAELGAPLPVLTRVVLGLSYSLARHWFLLLWLGPGLDALVCLGSYLMGGRKACRVYGIVLAGILVLLMAAAVIGLVSAMPEAGMR